MGAGARAELVVVLDHLVADLDAGVGVRGDAGQLERPADRPPQRALALVHLRQVVDVDRADAAVGADRSRNLRAVGAAAEGAHFCTS